MQISDYNKKCSNPYILSQMGWNGKNPSYATVPLMTAVCSATASLGKLYVGLLFEGKTKGRQETPTASPS
jgi:hypothetical protein